MYSRGGYYSVCRGLHSDDLVTPRMATRTMDRIRVSLDCAGPRRARIQLRILRVGAMAHPRKHQPVIALECPQSSRLQREVSGKSGDGQTRTFAGGLRRTPRSRGLIQRRYRWRNVTVLLSNHVITQTQYFPGAELRFCIAVNRRLLPVMRQLKGR